jgi:hypothetical protein
MMIAGGVHLVEASKQVYAPTRPGLGMLARRSRSVFEPVLGVADPV